MLMVLYLENVASDELGEVSPYAVGEAESGIESMWAGRLDRQLFTACCVVLSLRFRS